MVRTVQMGGRSMSAKAGAYLDLGSDFVIVTSLAFTA